MRSHDDLRKISFFGRSQKRFGSWAKVERFNCEMLRNKLKKNVFNLKLIESRFKLEFSIKNVF